MACAGRMAGAGEHQANGLRGRGARRISGRLDDIGRPEGIGSSNRHGQVQRRFHNLASDSHEFAAVFRRATGCAGACCRHVPLWIIVATALVINLRFMTFSVALAQSFSDFHAPARWLAGYRLTDEVVTPCLHKLLLVEDRNWRPGYYLAPSLVLVPVASAGPGRHLRFRLGATSLVYRCHAVDGIGIRQERYPDFGEARPINVVHCIMNPIYAPLSFNRLNSSGIYTTISSGIHKIT